MSQIAVRLTESELSMLDSAVTSGAFRTRAEAIRAGIHLVAGEAREARIAASYRSAYGKPLTDDENRMLEAAASLTDDWT